MLTKMRRVLCPLCHPQTIALSPCFISQIVYICNKARRQCSNVIGNFCASIKQCANIKQTAMKIILATFFLTFWSYYLFGDTWNSPPIRYYCSPNKIYCVKVFPRFTPESYYKWIQAKPKNKSKFSAEDTTITICHAMMYQVNGSDTILVWKKNLINMIAPTDGYVTNDGKYFVTIDNWYSMGYGIDVMVVYNSKGEMLKRYNLEDISPIPINDFMFSISSIHWFCGINIIDNKHIYICYKNDYIDKSKDFLFRTYNLEELKFENSEK